MEERRLAGRAWQIGSAVRQVRRPEVLVLFEGGPWDQEARYVRTAIGMEGYVPDWIYISTASKSAGMFGAYRTSRESDGQWVAHWREVKPKGSKNGKDV